MNINPQPASAPTMDILDALRDLHKQATTERSHYYVAKCCMDAISEIESLRGVRTLHESLTVTSVEPAGISWNGFNLFGDRKSIDEFKRLHHLAGQTEYFQKRLIEVLRVNANE